MWGLKDNRVQPIHRVRTLSSNVILPWGISGRFSCHRSRYSSCFWLSSTRSGTTLSFCRYFCLSSCVSPLVFHLICPDVPLVCLIYITYTGRRIGSDGSRTLQPPPTWSPLIISINPLKPLCPPRCTRFEKDPLTVNPRPPPVPLAVVPPLPPPPSAPFETVLSPPPSPLLHPLPPPSLCLRLYRCRYRCA